MASEESIAASRAIQEAIEKELRAHFGDKFVDSNLRIAKARDDFKTVLTHAIDSGRSGAAMAEFLNGNAWLWKHIYEDVERDPEFKAKVEHALALCSRNGWKRLLSFNSSKFRPGVPDQWHQAVREAKENHPAIMELRRRFR
jgi:hypothetical protein